MNPRFISSFISQVLQISVGNQLLSRYETKMKVVGLLSCSDRDQVTVTLKPYGRKGHQSTITRNLPCTIDSLRHFHHVFNNGGKEMKSSQPITSPSRHCLTCSDTWIYYIDPFNWADNIWTTTRLIIYVVLVLCFVTFILISVKLCLCFKQCC